MHETYLYNPAWSPIMRGSVDHFERDTNVRYFINLNDLVSMGPLGTRPRATSSSARRAPP